MRAANGPPAWKAAARQENAPPYEVVVGARPTAARAPLASPPTCIGTRLRARRSHSPRATGTAGLRELAQTKTPRFGAPQNPTPTTPLERESFRNAIYKCVKIECQNWYQNGHQKWSRCDKKTRKAWDLGCSLDHCSPFNNLEVATVVIVENVIDVIFVDVADRRAVPALVDHNLGRVANAMILLLLEIRGLGERGQRSHEQRRRRCHWVESITPPTTTPPQRCGGHTS